MMLDTLSDTESLGRALAAMLRPGDCILLEGPFGAGKTALVRALLRAACDDPALDVPSPSYTLVQSYEAQVCTLWHFDLWRLDGPQAVTELSMAELGWDEAREGIVLVEWPDRLGSLAPGDSLRLRLEPVAGHPGRRRAAMSGWSDRGLVGPT